MFLLLAGVSMAIKFEAQIARGVERRAMVRGGVWRGFEILVLAYLFRLQEYVLSCFWDWHDLLRVDILNCIGASMMLAAPITAPRARAPADRGRAAGGGGGHRARADHRTGAHLPAWLPRPSPSYIGGHASRWRRSR